MSIELNEDLNDFLWDWQSIYFFRFLCQIDDFSKYLDIQYTAKKTLLDIEKLIKDFYLYQRKYIIIDDEKKQQWCIIDRRTRTVIATSSYKDKDKSIIRSLGIESLLENLNNRRIQLK